MHNPICPNCGAEMEFDDHVQLGMLEYDTARLYLCQNEDCGKCLYEPYDDAEIERSRLNFCRRMVDSHNSHWHFTVDLRGESLEYEGLCANYTVFSSSGATIVASGYVAVDGRATGVHPYHPVESVYELVDMDIWRIFVSIQMLTAISQHVTASVSPRLNDLMAGDSELSFVKDRITSAISSLNKN